MEIQICQSCGIILRGKSKFCTGCGTTISKFSPTTLPVISNTAAPLAVTSEPDPLVLERALNRVQYAGALKGRADSWSARRSSAASFEDAPGNGNGHGNGHGEAHSGTNGGNGQSVPTSNAQPADMPAAPPPSPPPADPVGQAIATRLQNVLGQAAPNRAASSQFEPMSGSELEPEEAPASNDSVPGFSAENMSPEQQQAFLAQNGLWDPNAPAADLNSRLESFHQDPHFNPPSDPAPAADAPVPGFMPTPMAPPVGATHNSTSGAPAFSGVATSTATVGGTGVIQPPQPTASPPVSVTETGSNVQFFAPPAAEPAPPVAAPPASSSTKAPLDPGSMDFFASSRQKTAGSVSAKHTAARDADVPPADKKEPPSQPAQPEPEVEVDIPDGMPSVVAQALKAATTASNAAASAASTQLAKEEPDENLFPDESVNRGKKNKEETSKSDEEKAKDEETSNHTRRRIRASSDDEPSEEKKSNTIDIAGFSIPRGKAIAGILALFIGIPTILIVLNVIGALIGSVAQSAASMNNPNLNGTWDFGVLDTKGRTIKNNVFIVQSGQNLAGRGTEPGYYFVINGQYQYPKVAFQKTYTDQTFQQVIKDAKPVVFAGQVDWVNPAPGKNDIQWCVHMSGMWTLTKRVGYGWRSQVMQLQNKWEAGLVQPAQAPAGGTNIATIPGASGPPQAAGSPNFLGQILGQGAKPADVFMRVALFLIALGVGAVFLMFKMFGPAGMINIWSKKEYIPSQYKSQHAKMIREFGKPLKAGGVPLGDRLDWNPLAFWLPRQLAIPPDLRLANPHMLVLGAGSNGKSRLLASMIAHDIQSNDRAVVVIDSDGGLVDLVLSWITAQPKAKELSDRVVIIDPTHSEPTLCYNPLEFPDDGDLQSAASALVFGFKAIYTEPPGSQTQWTQQTADVLRNSAILLMANGKTLTDLPVLLSENDFRDVLLEKIERQKNDKAEYTALIEAWQRYKRTARTDQWINWIEPILNRVNPMLGNPRIRPILTKPKGDLNLKEIIAKNKILLVKVPQGHLDQNANLLGALIVTGLKQAAMSLSLKNTKRVQCAMYLDEFDDFIEKDTFMSITSETKKFGLGFVGASKTLQGLPEDYRNHVIINVGTMAIFALGKKDGDLLGPQMFRVDGRKIKNQTLQNMFNRVNTTPQFELITDEEKLNIDRVVGQEARTFFCYRVGTIAGVFHMRSPEFKDIPEKEVDWKLIDKVYGRSSEKR